MAKGGTAVAQPKQEEGSTPRRRYIRNPQRVDEIVMNAMERLHKERGDEFKAGISQIVEAIDKRIKGIPSRASVYRSLDRLAEVGKFQITRRGERGNYTYKFGAATPGSVTATSPAPSKANETTVVSADTDLATLLAEEESLVRQIQQRKSELLARIEQERAALAALEARLSPEREMVAA